MTKIVRAVIPIVFTVIGFALGGPLGAAIGSAIGTAAVSLLLPPSKGKSRAVAGTSLQLGEVPRQAIVGRAATPGSLGDAFNYGGKYGTDWEVLVIALADHRCDALEGFYVNDSYVAYGSDGMVAGFNNQLAVYWREGTETQTVPTILTTNGPGWTANDNGAGVAYVVVAYKADASDAKNPVWTNGRPKFLWVVRGARCYDSRKDSTAGGVGSHRWLNPSTWEWTDNPIVARYAFARGFFACDRVTQPDQLIVGRGLSAVEAPPENVFARANLCDELVDGEKRYRVGGAIIANETFIEVENDFAAACAGTISQPEGAVEIDPGEARAAVVTITDKDLVVGSKVKRRWFLGEGDRAWVNTVVPSYIEPAHKWSPHAAPVRRDTADVIADRGSREETITLGFVTWIKQAGRIGEIVRRLGRLQIRAELVLPPRFCELEEGDWIIWQSDRYLGGAAYTFRVDGWSSDKAWHHTVQLRQISASCYSDVAPLTSGSVAVNQAAPGAVGAPAGGSWALAAGYMEASDLVSPALIVTGTVDNSMARFVRFEYYRGTAAPTGATVWSDGGVTGPDVTRREIPVAASDTYRVAVSYVVDGIQGDRLILGPVTTGTGATNDGDRRDANILTIDEKIRVLKPKEERREIEYNDIIARATTLNTATLASAVTNLNTKRTAWLALRNAIAPAWDNIAVSSPITRTNFDLADREYDDHLSNLRLLISEEDARRATVDANGNLTGGGPNVVNVLVANALVSRGSVAAIIEGNSIRRSTGNGDYLCGVSSASGLHGSCFAEVVIQSGGYTMVGFDIVPTALDYLASDLVVHAVPAGATAIYSNGTYVGGFAASQAGQTLRVVCDDVNYRVYLDGVQIGPAVPAVTGQTRYALFIAYNGGGVRYSGLNYGPYTNNNFANLGGPGTPEPYATGSDNLVANSSLKNNSNNWFFSSAQVTRQVAGAGEPSPAHIRFDVVSTSFAAANNYTNTPLEGSRTLFASGYSLKAVGVTGILDVRIEWYNSVGAYLSQTNKDVMPLAGGVFQNWKHVFTAPADAAFFRAYYYQTTITGPCLVGGLRVAKTEENATVGSQVGANTYGLTGELLGGPDLLNVQIQIDANGNFVNPVATGNGTNIANTNVALTLINIGSGNMTIAGNVIKSTSGSEQACVRSVAYRGALYAAQIIVAGGAWTTVALDDDESNFLISNIKIAAFYNRNSGGGDFRIFKDGAMIYSAAIGAVDGVLSVQYDGSRYRIFCGGGEYGSTLDELFAQPNLAHVAKWWAYSSGYSYKLSLERFSDATNDRILNGLTTNDNPNWYLSRYAARSVVEEKDGWILGIPTAGGSAGYYGQVTTGVGANGMVQQYFVATITAGSMVAGQGFVRSATSGNAWGPWQRDFTGFAPPRLGNAGELLDQSGAALTNLRVLNENQLWDDVGGDRRPQDNATYGTVLGNAMTTGVLPVSNADPALRNSNLVLNTDGTAAFFNGTSWVSLGAVTIGGMGGGALAFLNNVNPATGQVLSTGSTPPSIPDNSFNYTSATSSVTITWPSLTIYRADGTTIAISAGSQAITGLASATTYKVYPYVVDSGGTSGSISFVTGGSGSPSAAFPSAGSAAAAAAMYGRANIPMGSFLAATVASGSGGGGGGGSGWCLHPSSLVTTEAGLVPADALKAGELLATPAGWSPIVAIQRKRASQWIGLHCNGTDQPCLIVTPTHVLYRADGSHVAAKDVRLGEFLSTDGNHAEVTRLDLIGDVADMVIIELPEPHLYYAGTAKLLSHNAMQKP